MESKAKFLGHSIHKMLVAFPWATGNRCGVRYCRSSEDSSFLGSRRFLDYFSGLIDWLAAAPGKESGLQELLQASRDVAVWKDRFLELTKLAAPNDSPRSYCLCPDNHMWIHL
jgi:hypothetical protein